MVTRDNREAGPHWTPRLALVGICLMSLGMSSAYNFIIPLGYGPDEPRHERYYQYILETWRLPRDEASTGAIVHHPPLYYLLCVPFYAAVKGLDEASGRLMRLMSAGLGLIVVILTYRMLLEVFNGRRDLALAGAASVAWWPHFQLIAAVISNDMLAAVWGTLVIYMAVLIALHGATLRRCILAGLFAGLGCYTKSSVAALAIVYIPALFLGAIGRSETEQEERARFDGDTLVRGGLACLLAWLVAGGWWTVSFFLTYGRLDVDPPWPLYTWPDPRLQARLLRGVWGLFRSSWVQVDWLPPASRIPIYAVLGVFAFASAAGLVTLFARLLSARKLKQAGAVAIPLLGALTLYLALLHNSIFTNPGRFEGGRYWLPAVAGYAGMWLPGLSGILGRWWRWSALAGLLILAVCNGLSYYWLVAYLNPTYGPK